GAGRLADGGGLVAVPARRVRGESLDRPADQPRVWEPARAADPAGRGAGGTGGGAPRADVDAGPSGARRDRPPGRGAGVTAATRAVGAVRRATPRPERPRRAGSSG